MRKPAPRPRGLAPSGPFEEHPDVASALARLAQRSVDGGASSMLFLPQRAAVVEAFAFAYGTGLAKEMNVLRKPAGPLRGTLVINVSGHATGGVVDRVVGFVAAELETRGVRVDGAAQTFLGLRNACDAAHRAFVSDPMRARAALVVEGPGLPPVELTRARYDTLAAVVIGSADYWRGNEALRRFFAATNTYRVRARLPDGTTLELLHVERNQPDTLESSTRIPLEIPDVDGTTVLQAWPTGSAEVLSYREAREYAVHSGRDFFDVEHQVSLAEKFQQLHDEIRWDSEHEAADREQHRVAPAPFPYEDF